MKKLKRIMSIILAALTLSLLMAQVTYAANACLYIRGSADDCNSWYTFEVTTGKNWGSNKITFSQTKGKLEYGVTGLTTDTYGAYTIKVTNESTNKTETYYWKYKSTYSLKLKDNTEYTIKIKPYQPSTVGDQNASTISSTLYKLFRVYDKNDWHWYDAPTWTVKSTKAVNWCTK